MLIDMLILHYAHCLLYAFFFKLLEREMCVYNCGQINNLCIHVIKR